MDIDAAARGRPAYAADDFVRGDAAAVLTGLADRLDGAFVPDPAFGDDLRRARAAAEARLRDAIAPYDGLVDALAAAMGRDALWVRDITVANSTWGNRLLKVYGPFDSVHPAGGGIGQGLAMAIGAAVAAPRRKVVCLTGDGGLALNMGELLTAVEVAADLALLVMNDRGYGVIRNIQDAQFGGRRCFVDLETPDFAGLAAACGMAYRRIVAPAGFASTIGDALARPGARIDRGRHDVDRADEGAVRGTDGRPLVRMPAPGGRQPRGRTADCPGPRASAAILRMPGVEPEARLGPEHHRMPPRPVTPADLARSVRPHRADGPIFLSNASRRHCVR